jgi:hypothetical protein
MTATERVFRGNSDDVLSMDDEAEYGKRFFELTYKEAIEEGIICDYKILTMVVSDAQVAKLIKENRILNLHWRNLDEVEARAVAAGIALKRVFKERGITHALTFHSSIAAAERFCDQQDALNKLRPKTENFHISSKLKAGVRTDLLREFKAALRAILTNARCMGEGVDVPAIDCVLFADPKQNCVDIIQAAGRAMRTSPGKKYGYILMPIVVPEGASPEKIAESTAFRRTARIVAALSTADSRIVDQFRAIQYGRRPTGKIVEIIGGIPVGMHMPFDQFTKAISTKIWEKVGRANLLPFEEARAFVRNLDLKSETEWREYCKSGKKPPNIPTHPQRVYAGWVSMGDWLGTGRQRWGDIEWQPFEKARAFVHRLGLKSWNDWKKYCASGRKPKDIPANPNLIYADTGWSNYSDWLGNGHQRSRWRSFKKARAFVRRLGLKSNADWRKYRASGKKPKDIPGAPDLVYADTDWTNWGDWLGTGTICCRLREYRPFSEARAFVRRLGLKSNTEWREYCKSGRKPKDIPATPENVYEEWKNWDDWLGNETSRKDRVRSHRNQATPRSSSSSLSELSAE